MPSAWAWAIARRMTPQRVAIVTGGVWLGQSLVSRLVRGVMDPPSLFNLVTPAFSVLVVFVLAEVFREGARLRRESELTI